MSTTLPLGRDVAYAIKASRATAPPLIADEIRELADRLTWGWDSREALQRFADRLDSPDADAVIASLILALRRTDGITANLLAIADSSKSDFGRCGRSSPNGPGHARPPASSPSSPG